MLETIIGADTIRVKQKIETLIQDDIKVYGNHERLYFAVADKEFSFDTIKQAVNTISLFENRKVIELWVKDIDLVKDTEENLAQLLTNLSHDIFFILVLEKKPLAKSPIKKLVENSRVHKIDTLNDMQKASYIMERLKQRGLRLSAQVMHEFENRIGNDFLRLEQEIDKLSVLEREVTIDDVRKLVSRDVEDNIFALSDALLKRNLKLCLEVYQDLLSIKIDPLALFGMIASSLRRNYQINALSMQGYTPQQIGSRLGISDKQAFFIVKNQSMNPNKTLKLLNQLAQSEQDAKSGKIDRFVALELFMIEATS